MYYLHVSKFFGEARMPYNTVTPFKDANKALDAYIEEANSIIGIVALHPDKPVRVTGKLVSKNGSKTKVEKKFSYLSFAY